MVYVLGLLTGIGVSIIVTIIFRFIDRVAEGMSDSANAIRLNTSVVAHLREKVEQLDTRTEKAFPKGTGQWILQAAVVDTTAVVPVDDSLKEDRST
jgi:hypothetical protein